MPRTATGIDVGRCTSKFLSGSFKKNTFHVTGFAFARHGADSLEEAWRAASPGFKPHRARIGLTGRDVYVRYTQVPRVPDWQLRRLMRFEVSEIGGQSGSEVASDFNLLPSLPEIEDEDVVLLAMGRESLLEEHLRGLKTASGKLDAFSPNALALYNAWLRFGAVQEETCLIANIGCENVDVILSRGPDLLFARNVSGGSKLIDDAIAARLGVTPAKAEEVKIRAVTLESGARFADSAQEKASRAALGAAGQILSLLQSTVLFCKNQIKLASLRVDRVLICGGGSKLKGLESFLSVGMGVPVERFDPFTVVDVSGLDPDSAALLEEHRLESVVALGLAVMSTDPEAYSIEIVPETVRRSREFWGGRVYLFAAGLLAVAFLGFKGWQTASQLRRIRAEAATLESEVRRAQSADRKARELAEENRELEQASSDLFALAGSGEQVARILAVLHRSLPAEFWITDLHSDWSFDPELGIERGRERPIVSVEGRAREGTESMAALYEGFIAAVRSALPDARLKQRPSPAGDRFTLDLTLLSAPASAGDDAPPSAQAAKPAQAEGSAPARAEAVKPARAEGFKED